MFNETSLNTGQFFESDSDELLINERMFIDFEMKKDESSNNYFIDNAGNLRYKIVKGKIFDFSF